MPSTEVFPEGVVILVRTWASIDTANQVKMRLVRMDCTDVPQHAPHAGGRKVVAKRTRKPATNFHGHIELDLPRMRAMNTWLFQIDNMAASKTSVLISYLERNKKVDIPSDKEENDLSYLATVCKKSFAFGSNVNIDITFQKYDEEWDSFIDLEDDYVASHRDKLKMIVTPILSDCKVSLPFLPPSEVGMVAR